MQQSIDCMRMFSFPLSSCFSARCPPPHRRPLVAFRRGGMACPLTCTGVVAWHHASRRRHVACACSATALPSPLGSAPVGSLHGSAEYASRMRTAAGECSHAASHGDRGPGSDMHSVQPDPAAPKLLINPCSIFFFFMKPVGIHRVIIYFPPSLSHYWIGKRYHFIYPSRSMSQT